MFNNTSFIEQFQRYEIIARMIAELPPGTNVLKAVPKRHLDVYLAISRLKITKPHIVRNYLKSRKTVTKESVGKHYSITIPNDDDIYFAPDIEGYLLAHDMHQARIPEVSKRVIEKMMKKTRKIHKAMSHYSRSQYGTSSKYTKRYLKYGEVCILDHMCYPKFKVEVESLDSSNNAEV